MSVWPLALAAAGIALASVAASTQSTGSVIPGAVDVRVAFRATDLAAEAEQLAARPQPRSRVVSASLLSDELLEGMLPWERWLGVSFVVDWPSATPAGNRFPEEIPRTSGTTEDVLSRRPDLVVLSPYNNALAFSQLRNLGVALTVVQTARTYGELFAQWRRLGRIVGTPKATEARIELAKADLWQVRTLAESLPRRPRALLLQGMFSYGSGTLQAAALREAGFDNALDHIEGVLSPQLNVEQVLSLDPDYVFVAASVAELETGSVSQLPESAQLAHLSAAKEGRVCAIPGSWMASISHHSLLASRAYVDCALQRERQAAAPEPSHE